MASGIRGSEAIAGQCDGIVLVPGSSGGRGWGGERGGIAKCATKDFSSSWLLSSFLAPLHEKLPRFHTPLHPHILSLFSGVLLQMTFFNL